MINPVVTDFNPPKAMHNILQTLNFKIYESLPRLLPYLPNPLFLNNIVREYQTIAWHSDWRVQFPHSIQYRMLRAITTGDIKQITLILKNPSFRINDPIDKKYGYNALQFAAIINQYTIIELLLMYGANINKNDKYGNSPLMYAVDKHNLQSINSLMKNGCNRKLKNNYEIDPIQKARSKPNQNYLVQFLQNYPETSRRFPKFKVKLQFEGKINNEFWDYVLKFKIYDKKPKLYPFNNFKGTYRIDFSPFETIEQILLKNKQKQPKNTGKKKN